MPLSAMIQLYHGDEYLYIGSPLHTCSNQNIFSWGHHYILAANKIYFRMVNTAYL
jgi:hypothetical protein